MDNLYYLDMKCMYFELKSGGRRTMALIGSMARDKLDFARKR